MEQSSCGVERLSRRGAVMRIRYGKVLFIVLLVLGFAFQGSRGLFEPDEGYYVCIAKAMAEKGEYLLPRLHQEPWLDKPPLSLWGVAAGLKLFGQNEWGARAFHGFCFVVTTLVVFLLGKSLYGRRTGLLGATIYATMVIPFAAGNVVTPDTPLALWTTLAFFCFWKSVEPDAQRVVLWKMLMCAAFGLGFLTKGPAALVAAGPMLLFLVIRRRALRYFMTPWAVVGVGLFLMFGLTWYAFITLHLPGSLDYIVDNELLGRTISDRYSRNPGLRGALIYLPVVLLGALPWSFFWLRGLKRNLRKVFHKNNWHALLGDFAGLFLSLWIVMSLAVFCLASSKMPLYVLQVFPALALATARLLPERVDRPWLDNPLRFSRRAFLALGLWVVVLVGMKFFACIYPHPKDMRALHAAIKPYLPTTPYEIVGVESHWEGLGFYDDELFERVATHEKPYPFFVLPEHLDEELSELFTTDYAHVFILHKERRAEMLRAKLNARGIAFEERFLPFQRYLFTVEALQKDKRVTRLVALAELGNNQGKLRGVSLGSALRMVYGEKSFSDGIFLLGDNLYCSSEGPDDLPAAARKEIEKPLESVIDLGVPFYAALGDNDIEYGLQAFELQYPLFNMQGRRYYSQVFGDGLVEAFILDSNTLRGEDVNPDPEQRQWLTNALKTSRSLWKVIVLHHPIYSPATRYPTDSKMVHVFEPLFREYGVALVLQGHNHIYERLRPVHGIHYVTVGSTGNLRPGDLRSEPPECAATNDRDPVFLLVEFNHKSCRLTAYDTLLNVIDEYEIFRS